MATNAFRILVMTMPVEAGEPDTEIGHGRASGRCAQTEE